MVLVLPIESCTYDYLTPEVKCMEEFDELSGGMEQLAGNWEWYSSIEDCLPQYPPNVRYCYYTPQSEGYTITLKVNQDASYEKYKDNVVIENGGLEYEIYTSSPEVKAAIYFVPCIDKEYTYCHIIGGGDTLRLSSYPFDGSTFQNYFARK